jgi:hypothetical protein
MPNKKLKRCLQMAPQAMAVWGGIMAAVETVTVFAQCQFTFALLVTTAETGISLFGLFTFLRHRRWR